MYEFNVWSSEGNSEIAELKMGNQTKTTSPELGSSHMLFLFSLDDLSSKLTG